MQPEAAVINKLACPECQSSLESAEQSTLKCQTCSTNYQADNVIDLLTDKSKRSTLEDVDYDNRAGVCQDSCTPNQETAFTLLTGFNVTVSV